MAESWQFFVFCYDITERKTTAMYQAKYDGRNLIRFFGMKG